MFKQLGDSVLGIIEAFEEVRCNEEAFIGDDSGEVGDLEVGHEEFPLADAIGSNPNGVPFATAFSVDAIVEIGAGYITVAFAGDIGAEGLTESEIAEIAIEFVEAFIGGVEAVAVYHFAVHGYEVGVAGVLDSGFEVAAVGMAVAAYESLTSQEVGAITAYAAVDIPTAFLEGDSAEDGFEDRARGVLRHNGAIEEGF